MKEFTGFDILLIVAAPFIGAALTMCAVSLLAVGGFFHIKDCIDEWKWGKLKRQYEKPWEDAR